MIEYSKDDVSYDRAYQAYYATSHTPEGGSSTGRVCV